jgi:transcriptional regulator with XRE-family HTH domain
MSQIGPTVQRLRVAKGWNRERLAVESDLSIATITRLENDQRSPALDTLRQIARALDVNVADLLGDDESDAVAL